ncbi:class I SAM-dependent methyltransferase [Muricoccus aerilatus]|uniref:class I SAM-dependent methyltransferase n=1 Tax=Muricoccus aerilatus TaxID=452982 RepID=UPI0005C132A8|nr:class I SAM-dependent methyltransferase [Roseomonas aerilata]
MPSEPTPATPDLAALKARQRGTWASGDYALIGSTLQIVGESLCEALDLRAGERVLDIAAGNGNASLAAARRFATVTSSDYVPELLDQGRLRAEANRLPIRFEVADAEALPFADAHFDVVLSTFGVMFTPDQEKAAAEMRRVCRPGGRIGLANWTPAGFVGQLFKLLGTFLPPPAGVRSPALWGTEERLRELFPGASVEVTPRVFHFRYRSAAHWLEVFRSYYGPLHKAFQALDPDTQSRLEENVLDLLGRFDRGGGAGLVVASDYIEAIIRLPHDS